MPLHDTIKQHIKDAMRAKDALKLDVLRGVQSLVGQEMIAKGIAGDTLEDTSLIALIKRAVKQRKDSIEQFTKGGRADLATKEQSELAINEVSSKVSPAIPLAIISWPTKLCTPRSTSSLRASLARIASLICCLMVS
jgi:hypothetical protein